jgi:predicted nucleotidyltransferase
MVPGMDREHVITKLRAHEAELKTAGIARLRLFGSVARGEQGNDVDLVAEFNRPLSLIDLVGLENRLSDLLECKVDLAQERTLKPRVRINVEREAILAF